MVVATLSPASLWMLERGTANLRRGSGRTPWTAPGPSTTGPSGRRRRGAPSSARSCCRRPRHASRATRRASPTPRSPPDLRRGQLEDARGGCALGATRAQAAQPVRPSGGRGDRRPRRGQLARYRVRGFVVRSGAVEGLPYQPPPGEFHLIVELAPQEDAMQQGRYPFVVVRHRAVVRWPGSLRRHERGDLLMLLPFAAGAAPAAQPIRSPIRRAAPEHREDRAAAEADERRPVGASDRAREHGRDRLPLAGRGLGGPRVHAGRREDSRATFVVEATRGKPRIFVTPVAADAHRVLHVVLLRAGGADARRADRVHPGPPGLAWRKVVFRRETPPPSRGRPSPSRGGPRGRGCASRARNRRSAS
jgi:hypothetical protein